MHAHGVTTGGPTFTRATFATSQSGFIKVIDIGSTLGRKIGPYYIVGWIGIIGRS